MAERPTGGPKLPLPPLPSGAGVEAQHVQTVLLHTTRAGNNHAARNHDRTGRTSAGQLDLPGDVFRVTPRHRHALIVGDAVAVRAAELPPIGAAAEPHAGQRQGPAAEPNRRALAAGAMPVVGAVGRLALDRRARPRVRCSRHVVLP
ncbi:MAG: hypothetical protein A2W31_07230 [Planctomycetes bacterium RBG_16_64_10]|nr:MAG: hypothetical protein A2W31_07230 [Planctomycetes bacterium RBG_16_64_10]